MDFGNTGPVCRNRIDQRILGQRHRFPIGIYIGADISGRVWIINRFCSIYLELRFLYAAHQVSDQMVEQVFYLISPGLFRVNKILSFFCNRQVTDRPLICNIVLCHNIVIGDSKSDLLCDQVLHLVFCLCLIRGCPVSHIIFRGHRLTQDIAAPYLQALDQMPFFRNQFFPFRQIFRGINLKVESVLFVKIMYVLTGGFGDPGVNHRRHIFSVFLQRISMLIYRDFQDFHFCPGNVYAGHDVGFCDDPLCFLVLVNCLPFLYSCRLPAFFSIIGHIKVSLQIGGSITQGSFQLFNIVFA